MKKTSIHVLIAEDDAAHANAIRRAFEAGGPETVVKVVGTLREFRQHSVEKPPDIAVMDLNLPDGRAVEALTYPPEAGPFPILLMTSYGNEQVAVTAIKSGALDYVVKSPEAFADMPHTITHALHEWSLLQERKRAEEALRAEERRYQTLAEVSPVGIFRTDAQGQTTYVNPRWCQITGLSARDALGKGWLCVVHSQDREQVAQGWHEAVQAPHSLTADYRFVHPDGTVAWVMGQAVPEKDDAGRVVGYVGTITDITEKKQLESRLLRTQRLESVGRLASGIAHDLNNILAPMLMSAPVLREAIQDPDLRQLVDTIESSAVRGADIIRQLLTFGRGLEGERVPVQLKSLVQDMCNIIRETFPKNIVAVRETPAGAWLVRGDATQLHQILMNLCVNARDAMPDGGTLTLAAENVEVNEAVAAMNPGA